MSIVQPHQGKEQIVHNKPKRLDGNLINYMKKIIAVGFSKFKVFLHKNTSSSKFIFYEVT